MRGRTLVRRVGGSVVRVGAAAAMFGAMLFSACEEHLPVRNDPTLLFTGSVQPQYVMQFLENDVRFTVNIANVFDETLQDTASLLGQLQVTLLRDPTAVRTIQLTPDSLLTTWMYDRYTHVLTIDPGDTLRLLVRWDLVDDQNRFLPWDVLNTYQDVSCTGRFFSREEFFSVRGNVSVFRKTGLVNINPRIFSFCYISRFVAIRDCPLPVTDCSLHGTP